MTYEEMEQIAGLDLDVPEQRERAMAWRIEDLPALEWSMGVLAEAEREAAEIKEQTIAAVLRVNARGEHLLARVAKRTAFLRAAVEDYARVHRSDLLRGKAKTRNLVHGSISYTDRTQETIEIEDAEAALAWCREQPAELGLVRTKYEIDKRNLDVLIRAGHEIPPGVKVVPPASTITIRPEQPETINLPAAPTKEIAP